MVERRRRRSKSSLPRSGGPLFLSVLRRCISKRRNLTAAPSLFLLRASGQRMVQDFQLSILRIIVRPGYCWMSASRQQPRIVAERLSADSGDAPTHACMPMRQRGMLASRVSTWLRDNFWRRIAPILLRPRWKVFLPMSMQRLQGDDLAWHGMLLVLAAPCHLCGWAGAGARRVHPINRHTGTTTAV